LAIDSSSDAKKEYHNEPPKIPVRNLSMTLSISRTPRASMEGNTYWDAEWAEEWPSGHSSTCEAEWSFRHCRDRGRGSWHSCSTSLSSSVHQDSRRFINPLTCYEQDSTLMYEHVLPRVCGSSGCGRWRQPEGLVFCCVCARGAE